MHAVEVSLPAPSLFFPVGNAVWNVEFCLSTLMFSVKGTTLGGCFSQKVCVSAAGSSQRQQGKPSRALGKARPGTQPLAALLQGSGERRFPGETREVKDNLPSRQPASWGKQNFIDLKNILFGKRCPGNFVCLFYFVLE